MAHTDTAVATASTKSGIRTVMILAIVALAFIGSYQLATAATGSSTATGAAGTNGALIPAFDPSTGGAGAGGAGCACCGNSGTGETIEGAATVEGDVQRITVDASAGYNPNVITLVAGVPAEITFTQGSGCMAQVMSEDLGFYEDLQAGPKTVRIEADQLQPGEYGFSCGMQMVFGTIIVE